MTLQKLYRNFTETDRKIVELIVSDRFVTTTKLTEQLGKSVSWKIINAFDRPTLSKLKVIPPASHMWSWGEYYVILKLLGRLHVHGAANC